ncbi:unannotated protein [freshwater metagenome]|uniref:Unannotated protein n=1 Tax=freshwater metagenome TaxID=449393 RepID=A0A6J7J6K3_9ZZZZ|nr:hypothetical protein [Actinomycetota bacterium]
MYDRLTPLFRSVTDAALVPSTDGTGYFKSAAILQENDPSFIVSQTVSGRVGGKTVSARIKRDAYGVPFVFSGSDAGAIFAAGYVVATDQALLLTQARFNGRAALIDMPGVSAIRLVLGLYSYTPNARIVAAAARLQTKNILAQGARGKQLLRDIDTYIAGINKRLKEASPSVAKFTRTDIYALNAIKAQFLGEGGGNETQNALFLSQLRTTLGATRGDGAFKDLQARDDPEASVTTTKAFPAQTAVSVTSPKGMVRLRAGSFRSASVTLPGSSGLRALQDPNPTGPRQLASNILIVSGSRSATGTPVFVGGPQIGYNYPGLTLEM